MKKRNLLAMTRAEIYIYFMCKFKVMKKGIERGLYLTGLLLEFFSGSRHSFQGTVRVFSTHPD